MTTPMTPRQRQLAEEHMDLVPRMVAALTKGFSLSSDQRRELCQTGYLALCRAAVSCREGYDFPRMPTLRSAMPFTIPGGVISGKRTGSAPCRKTSRILSSGDPARPPRKRVRMFSFYP